ncbi:hypothetical protein SLS62_000651 [Diatrype stigma]|uniref:Kinesin motor domain-containing protein n=1 Tax=Diatrype stigma TaxID=117547 RepID=A0AAN9UWZ9_9PEZI
METFLLENVGLYKKLVKQFKPEPPPPPSAARTGKQATVPSPDMVVSARIRPLLEEDIASGFPCALFPRPHPRQPGAGIVDVHDLYHHPRGRPVLKSFSYEVDRLFGPDATAQEIYDAQVADLVAFARAGGTGTLFAYGQTGSGKTTTISGLEKLVVQALLTTDGGDDGRGGDVVDSNNKKKKTPPRQNVYMSIIELAGNSAYDLLRGRRPIQIMEDAHGVTRLIGAEEHLLVPGPAGGGGGGAKTGRGTGTGTGAKASGAAHATALIERAMRFRHTASTRKNDASSRSHSICRLRIRQQEEDEEGEPSPAIISSTSDDDNDEDGDGDGLLYLVDLAGSEAARDVATHGADRMREAREINISLSVLKDCIRGKAKADAQQLASSVSSRPSSGRDPGPSYDSRPSLSLDRNVFNSSPRKPAGRPYQWKPEKPKQKAPPHIPFRQSALTKILKHVFDPSPSPLPSSRRTGTRTAAAAAAAARRRTKTVVVACVNPSLADVGPSKNTLRYAEMLRVSVPASAADALLAAPPGKPSSRDPDPEAAASVPFRDRIRPGMVVSYYAAPASSPDESVDSVAPDDAQLAVVLSRFDESVSGDGGGDGGEDGDSGPASDETDGDELGGAAQGDNGGGGDGGGGARYLCAQVTPGAESETYEVNLWQQVVVDVSNMEKEVVLEYDAETRYYQIASD